MTPDLDGKPPAPRRFRLPWPVKRGGQLLLIALVIEFLLVPQIAGERQSLHLLLDLDSPWLVAAVVLELGSFLSFAAATRALLPHGRQPPYGKVLRIDMATIGLAHSVPGGNAAGAALGLRLLSEAGATTDEAGFAKVAQALGSALVLVVLLLTAVAIAIPLHGSSPLYLTVSGVGLVALVVVPTMAVVLHRGRPALARIAGSLTRRLPRVPDEAGANAVARLGAQIDLVLAERRRIVIAAAWGTLNWLLDAATLWASVRTYGHTLGYDGVMVSFALAHVAAWVPITPGGLGIVEGVLVPTLISFGTPRATAVLGVLTYRLISFWSTIPLGAAAYGGVLHARRRRRRRHQRELSDDGDSTTSEPRETRQRDASRRAGAGAAEPRRQGGRLHR